MCDLKKKFEEWGEWLFGDDIHSIHKQIRNMIWDSAIYLSINEARKYAPCDEKDRPQLNAQVHGFINRCFFRTQALAIRRLLDREIREGERSVYSLYRLIDDIEKNFELLTRRDILAAHEFPYDYEIERDKLFQIRMQEGEQGWLGRDLVNCAHSETIHEAIDSMADVDPTQRTPNDTVRENLFVWLKERLDSCEEIFDYVNKFIAHSATPESRALIEADEIEITLGKILDAHKTICETAAFIGMKILYRSFGGFMAIPQFDQFKYFEKPWATEDTVKKLRVFWHEYDQKTREWENWDWQSEFNKSK